MRLLLCLILTFSAASAWSQEGYLFVKKGNRKVRTFAEGDMIKIRSSNGGDLSGPIRLLRNDSIFIRDYAFSTADIERVYTGVVRREPPRINLQEWALITLGVGLSTAGMAGAGWETPKRALIYSATIGYGPLLLIMLVRKLPLQREAYIMGKHYRLQVLDFHR